ncbi:MAG: Hpt domain-containing protein [Nitrospirales bacterium]|nr:Hpt domain-containing protein [Nitrospirales bacterium]
MRSPVSRTLNSPRQPQSDQVQDAAHGLKGIARNMGAEALAELALHIETACRSGEVTPLSQHEP